MESRTTATYAWTWSRRCGRWATSRRTMRSRSPNRERRHDPARRRAQCGVRSGHATARLRAAGGVERGGVTAGEAYCGIADKRTGRRVDEGTVWSLASVTKPFTAGAVMLLVEEGRLSLDEPLHQVIPEFLDAPETQFDRRRVTLRHVLSHCSGLPGVSEDNTDLRKAHRPLEDFVRSFGRQPLFFEPGAAHLYSNPGILMAAEAVGRALTATIGQRLETPAVGRYHGFVHERILAPLGMTSSSLKPSADWDERIAFVERSGQEGTDYEAANSAYYRSLGIPWGGMFSTPRDAPVEVAPNQRDAAARTPPLSAVEWGIGWEIKGTKRPHRSGELTSPATYGHAGATGTMVWGCPLTDVHCVLLTNRTLVSGRTTERPRQAQFSNAVMAAVL